MSTIGFIGLGNMGLPMARNLLAAGHGVRGFDVVPEALEAARANGVEIAASAAAAARGAEVAITMLPAGEHVRDVYLGAGKLLAAADPGTLLIDSSTIDVATAREVHGAAGVYLGAGKLLAAADPGTLLIDSSTIDVATAREVHGAAGEAGLTMVDAPVSGGVSGAEAATLTFMVGGTDEAFARARPLLSLMGRNILHAGGPGTGQAAKTCNNMILGISMIAVAEAFNLGEALGIEAERLYEISSKASGSCWAMLNHHPLPGIVETSAANRGYEPGFAAAMMHKDLKL
jgi:3-hydroxyisobutyrate dehydrogenase